MIPLPNPLHPALVHFPIVLILLGATVALVAVIFRRWHLPWLSAGLLVGGALGAIAATWSGDEEEDLVGKLPSPVAQILEAHEEWGERTRNLSILAAVLAVASAAAARFPKTSQGLGIATTLVAAVAVYTVAQAGHYGGQLVYQNGVGIKKDQLGQSPIGKLANDHK